MYEQRWSVNTPGCLIILLDQSGSMQESAGLNREGNPVTRAEAAARILNNMVSEIVARCEQGGVIRPRVHVSVVGYGANGGVRTALGGNLTNRDIVPIDELAANTLRVDKLETEDVDLDTGATFMRTRDLPVWVEPVADNGTPMCAAFDAAFDVAQNWAMSYNDSFPPIIVNITDGEPTDGDPMTNASQISQVGTNDGQALVFNVHVSGGSTLTSRYPSDATQVPSDLNAQMLFRISSVLPDPIAQKAKSEGISLSVGARGCVFNGEMSDLAKFLTIASQPQLR